MLQMFTWVEPLAALCLRMSISLPHHQESEPSLAQAWVPFVPLFVAASFAMTDAPANTRDFLAKAKVPGWTAKASMTRLGSKSKVQGKVPAYRNKPTAGAPPAPLHVYGSDGLVAHHMYRWDKETTMAAHARPDRHSIVINGRPMQARGQITFPWVKPLAT